MIDIVKLSFEDQEFQRQEKEILEQVNDEGFKYLTVKVNYMQDKISKFDDILE